MKAKFYVILSTMVVFSLLVGLIIMPVIASSGDVKTATATDKAVNLRLLQQANPADSQAISCALLDNPSVRGVMSGAFELKLLIQCGREAELGQVASTPYTQLPEDLGVDILVNDPTGDTGPSRTQSETSLALSSTGILCSGYNDSYHGVTQGLGYSGFSSSTDQAASWTDHGAVIGGPGLSFGDPSVVWSQRDGTFYFASIHSSGLGLWNLGTGCDSSTWIGMIHSGGNDDKELMTTDNNPASPYYGRLYVAWTNFDNWHIYVTHSDNSGGNWSTPVDISLINQVQGAWPTVDPITNDVYVAWVHFDDFSNGPNDMEIVRSTDGGDSFDYVTSPASNTISPRDANASANCGRPALNGNIRYLPSPQIDVDANSNLHVVYSYDPDGYNTGDVINVYYRRSTDQGATWEPEILLNDDGTTRDQWFPSLVVNPDGIVGTFWYDRRNDASNLLYMYYGAVSQNNGVSFQPNQQISDVASPVILDPNLNTCYHGDYDTSVADEGQFYIQWSDDRQGDADVWSDTSLLGPDFNMAAAPEAQAVCAPNAVDYQIDLGSRQGFTDPVDLSTIFTPASVMTSTFSVDPVVPPGSTVLTVGNTGAAAEGHYDIEVTGTAPTKTHSITVGLDVYAGLALAPILLSPADGASGQPVQPAFSWTGAGMPSTYDFQIALDEGFTQVVEAASGLTETSYTPAASLNTSERYYWRVRTDNACGEGEYAAASVFTTVVLASDCAVDYDPVVAYTQGFESGLGGWTHSGTNDTWGLSGVRTHSGSWSMNADDPTGQVSDQMLVSPEFDVPSGLISPTLQYWNYQSIEDRAGGCYDGGLLEISTDGGGSWTQVESGLVTDPYDGVIASGHGNPLAGQEAWCGDPESWLNSVVDLSGYAGQRVEFRYRLGSDNRGAVNRQGWFIDDVVVQSCAVEAYAVEWGGGSSLEGQAGETVTHTFQLNNVGLSDSYSLGISGNSWPTQLVGPGTVTLEPGGTQSVEVVVEVPQLAAVIASDSFTLTATSEGEPSVKAEAVGLTQQTATAGVSLAATPEGGSASPGSSVVYELEVTNTGSYTDTFSLSATGLWTATLGASSTGELGAGESAVVVLEVQVPAGAVIGDSDQTTVTAVSGLDGSVTATLLVETTAANQLIFLPMISNE